MMYPTVVASSTLEWKVCVDARAHASVSYTHLQDFVQRVLINTMTRTVAGITRCFFSIVKSECEQEKCWK